MSNVEVEVLRWAGQAGAGGAIVYLLIRFGPLVERLLSNRNGHHNPEEKRIVTWEALVEHCTRQHTANRELADTKYEHLKEAVNGLKQEVRDGLNRLGNRIDKRNGTN